MNNKYASSCAALHDSDMHNSDTSQLVMKAHAHEMFTSPEFCVSMYKRQEMNHHSLERIVTKHVASNVAICQSWLSSSYAAIYGDSSVQSNLVKQILLQDIDISLLYTIIRYKRMYEAFLIGFIITNYSFHQYPLYWGFTAPHRTSPFVPQELKEGHKWLN